MSEEHFEEEQCYTILDEHGFALAVAESVAGCFDSENVKEVLGYVNEEQILNCVREKCLGFDDDQMIINTKIYEDTVNDLAQMMQGKMLAKLAAEGFLESAWDDELNEMVFWLADEDKQENEKKT